jgi:hypothetical protein
VLLLREGWQVNHKRVYRLYRQEGLSLRNKKVKKRISVPREVGAPALSLRLGWFYHGHKLDTKQGARRLIRSGNVRQRKDWITTHRGGEFDIAQNDLNDTYSFDTIIPRRPNFTKITPTTSH